MPGEVTSKTRLNSVTLGNQSWPRVAVGGDRTWIAVWDSEGHDGSGLGVVGEQIDGGNNFEGTVAPLVRVEAIDPTASRWFIQIDHGTSTGAFLVRRTGDISEALTVYYSLDSASTAIPGGDYQVLTGSVVIPAGKNEDTQFACWTEPYPIDPPEFTPKIGDLDMDQDHFATDYAA